MFFFLGGGAPRMCHGAGNLSRRGGPSVWLLRRYMNSWDIRIRIKMARDVFTKTKKILIRKSLNLEHRQRIFNKKKTTFNKTEITFDSWKNRLDGVFIFLELFRSADQFWENFAGLIIILFVFFWVLTVGLRGHKNWMKKAYSEFRTCSKYIIW